MKNVNLATNIAKSLLMTIHRPFYGLAKLLSSSLHLCSPSQYLLKPTLKQTSLKLVITSSEPIIIDFLQASIASAPHLSADGVENWRTAQLCAVMAGDAVDSVRRLRHCVYGGGMRTRKSVCQAISEGGAARLLIINT